MARLLFSFRDWLAQAVIPAGVAAGASPGRGNRSVRMLAAYLDAAGSYRVEGEQTDAKAELRSLRLESHVNLNNEFIEQKLAEKVRLFLTTSDGCNNARFHHAHSSRRHQ